MYLQSVFLCLVLVELAAGVQITHPTIGTNWTTSGPNIISWEVDHGDPPFVNIQLAHNNRSSFQPIAGLLPADGIIATGVDITTVEMLFTPSCFPDNPSLPAGPGYSLRFLPGLTNRTQSILNSTKTFHIIATNATVCIGLHTSTAGSTSSSIAIPSNTAMPSSIFTSSGDLTPSTSNWHAGAIAAGLIGGLVVCDLLICGVVVYNRRQRHARKMRTQQFVMKNEMIGGAPIESIEFMERPN